MTRNDAFRRPDENVRAYECRIRFKSHNGQALCWGCAVKRTHIRETLRLSINLKGNKWERERERERQKARERDSERGCIILQGDLCLGSSQLPFSPVPGITVSWDPTPRALYSRLMIPWSNGNIRAKIHVGNL